MSDATIVLVRHGQSTGNLEKGRFQGRSNQFNITKVGERQAALVGPWLKNRYGTPDAVVASPALRTKRTAQIALEAAGVQIDIATNDDLQEISRGSWEGELYKDVVTLETQAYWDTHGMTFQAPGGESYADVRARMVPALERLPKGNVWVFGHGLAIRCAVGALIDWDYDGINNAHDAMYNTAATELSRDAAGLHLSHFALAEHLPPELLTT